jgi:hypothetical protein
LLPLAEKKGKNAAAEMLWFNDSQLVQKAKSRDSQQRSTAKWLRIGRMPAIRAHHHVTVAPRERKSHFV